MIHVKRSHQKLYCSLHSHPVCGPGQKQLSREEQESTTSSMVSSKMMLPSHPTICMPGTSCVKCCFCIFSKLQLICFLWPHLISPGVHQKGEITLTSAT